MSDNSLTVDLHGSVFDGHAAEDIAKMAEDCQRAVAERAEFAWQMKMDDSFRHPTGYYQSHINIAQRDKDLVVNDQGVVYGFWLEGIGSRNAPVTSFKGYFARRWTVESVGRQVTEICTPIVDKAIEKINHG
jgi:hypothetical protein